MIYIIISNIGFALITLVMFFRYSHFRITSNFTIRDLKKSLQEKIDEQVKIEERLNAEIKKEVEEVKKLLRQIEGLHKEKKEEMRLRLEAEKQIELALQKTQEVQKRMDDWKMLQDSTMQDSKDAILKVGNDLLKKLTKVHKDGVDEHKNAVESSFKNVHNYLEGIAKNVEEVKQKSSDLTPNSKTNEVAVNIGAQAAVKAAPMPVIDETTKQLQGEIVSIIKAAGHLPNKDYILASSLDGEKARMMLCDIVFLKNNVLYLIDLKANRYFLEYAKLKITDKDAAMTALKNRLDKYIAYIANPKYAAMIEKLMANMRMKYGQVKVVFLVNTRNELSLLKDIQYLEKAQQAKLEVYDFDKLSDLIL